MKKNTIYLLVLLGILLLAGIVFLTNRKGTMPKELMDFAIADTSSVTKVFMADKAGKKVTLQRSGDHWEVNNSFHARKDAIDMLLKTMNRMEVKAPVSKASFENVVKNLAASHVKVEVYTNGDKPAKVFFVGGPTADNFGTYMMLENSSTPFIVHIPGFSGYLSTRFFLNESEWRDISLFRYEFNEIKSVRIDNQEHPEQSFEIRNDGNNGFELLNIRSNQLTSQFDLIKIKQYLAAYKKLNFERFVTELKEHQVDSVIQSAYIYKMTVTDSNNKTTSLKAFLRPAEMPTEQYPYDSDRMYGQINDSKELIIIQYFNFDPLFTDYSYFLK